MGMRKGVEMRSKVQREGGRMRRRFAEEEG